LSHVPLLSVVLTGFYHEKPLQPVGLEPTTIFPGGDASDRSLPGELTAYCFTTLPSRSF
jgi:hypothetical protein